jgi:hypothetical protein
MADRIFQICGATVPPLVGRKNAFQKLRSALTKATPDRLQVVGPRFVGKTVLLHAFADAMRKADSPYKAVLLWDLGQQTPDSDEQFLLALRDRLADSIQPLNKDYADHLRSAKEKPYHDICEVTDALGQEGIKLLMLWDGFDKPLGNGRLTRNLWDQLKEFASRPTVALVTASRKRLHELIRSAETQASTFWGIFDTNPLSLERFEDEDVDIAISRLDKVTFLPGARAEVLNWTGGFPPLFLTLLNAINEERHDGSVDGAAVKIIAETVAGSLDPFIDALWADCPQSSRDLFHEIVSGGAIKQANCSHLDLVPLLEKGFVKKSGTDIQSSCRFLDRYMAHHAADVGSMVRLFGSAESFRRSVRPILERRLSHLDNVDPTLKRYLARSIEDLPDHPEVCISNIRGIVDCALDLIWAAELGASKIIPPDYFTSWQFDGEKGAEQHWNGKFPFKRGHQVRLLHLLTGTEKSAHKAKCVSRATFALVSAAHGFGDFGQHLDGATIGVTVAFAAMSLCLELASNLEHELGQKQN